MAGDALAFVFDHHGFYVRLADDLIDEVPWRRRVRHHGLCVCLDAASKSLDPAAYARLAQIPTRTALLRLGFPKFLADILTGSSAFEVKEILGALPAAHLWHSLRVTIPLVCRDFPVCPARMDVVETFASPVLGRELERFVATLR
ncbi:hypothetical protein FPZ12_002925 [Amycolatopsis acidicola]|uniref:Uncharacterized protein n=1 Tax=Amycolatopsis acidicola TaxID=2596893 RepID=A0A5N0VN07_9PSEU|nr:hypothetical protein FPZ12_002925 [Amycolatopsis acidicola]